MACQPEKWDARSVAWVSTRGEIEYKFLNCLVCFSTSSCHSTRSMLLPWWIHFSLSCRSKRYMYFIFPFCCSYSQKEKKRRRDSGISSPQHEGLKRRSGGLVMAVVEEEGGCRVLISKLPWRAAIAVRGYERSFAKVRQIPPHSVLIGLSGLQNREGM